MTHNGLVVVLLGVLVVFALLITNSQCDGDSVTIITSQTRISATETAAPLINGTTSAEPLNSEESDCSVLTGYCRTTRLYRRVVGIMLRIRTFFQDIWIRIRIMLTYRVPTKYYHATQRQRQRTNIETNEVTDPSPSVMQIK